MRFILTYLRCVQICVAGAQVSVCLSDFLSICLSFSVCLSVRPSLSVSVRPPVCPFPCPSLCLRPSVCLSICLSLQYSIYTYGFLNVLLPACPYCLCFVNQCLPPFNLHGYLFRNIDTVQRNLPSEVGDRVTLELACYMLTRLHKLARVL